jgi:hypothetical protein
VTVDDLADLKVGDGFLLRAPGNVIVSRNGVRADELIAFVAFIQGDLVILDCDQKYHEPGEYFRCLHRRALASCALAFVPLVA